MPINTNRWNRIRYTVWAPIYDLVAGGFRPQRRRSLSLLDLQPGESVLLLGAGTGEDLPFLPAGAAVTAIDITPAMVERVRRRASCLGLAVDARVMDGQRLAFPDASFDAVVLHLILAVIPDPVACIREVARVLKPGGRVVVFDKFLPDGARPSFWRRAFNVVANLLFTDVTRRLGPLLAAGGLHLVRREPAAYGGFFEIALAQR